MSTYASPNSELPFQNLNQTLGKDHLLTLNRLSVAAAEYMGAVESINMPAGSITVRNYVETHEDVEPTAAIDFGKWVTIKFGNEGFSNLVAAELCFQMPRVVNNATTGDLHPKDPTYVSAGGGSASDYINWIDFIGERLIGDDDNPLRFSHATETLREYTSTGQHIRRRLCQDSEGTSKRVAYENAVGGGSADSTQYARQYYVPLHLPWAIDEWEPRQTAPLHAFANEQQLKFKIPTLKSLLSTNIGAANILVDTTNGPAFSCFLRLHYVVTELAERTKAANLAMTHPGITYMTSHIARETPSAVVTGRGATTVDVEIRNQTNPFHFLAFVVRNPDDLLAVGDGATGSADTYPTPRAASNLIQSPQFTRFLSWDSFEILDGSNRLTPRYSSNYQTCSYHKGISRYFPCDIITKIGFYAPCMQPAVENQGLGHGDFTSNNKPILRVYLPEITAAGPDKEEYSVGASLQRRVDVFYFERNKIYMRNGIMIRMYNVAT